MRTSTRYIVLADMGSELMVFTERGNWMAKTPQPRAVVAYQIEPALRALFPNFKRELS